MTLASAVLEAAVRFHASYGKQSRSAPLFLAALHRRLRPQDDLTLLESWLEKTYG